MALTPEEEMRPSETLEYLRTDRRIMLSAAIGSAALFAVSTATSIAAYTSKIPSELEFAAVGMPSFGLIAAGAGAWSALLTMDIRAAKKAELATPN